MKLILESSEPMKDIEALAKSRVNRKESKRTNYYILGVLAAFIIGVFCFRVQQYGLWLGYGVMVAAVIVFVVYMQGISKKQRIAISKLKREWRDTQELVTKETVKQ